MSAMSLDHAPDRPAPATSRPVLLGILLMIAALIELVEGMSSLPVLFGDMSKIPGPGVGGFLIKAQIATRVPLALAALATAGFWPRHAITALAAVALMSWLGDMPSVVLHGIEFGSMISAVETVARIVAFPLMAVCAIALARRNERLWTAALLACFPTLFKIAGVVIFAISVSIYGF